MSDTRQAGGIALLRAELIRERRKYTFGEEQRRAQAARLAEIRTRIDAALRACDPREMDQGPR